MNSIISWVGGKKALRDLIYLVESEDVPKELLDICAELGIPREKVNIVLRMTEEGNDEKAGV